MSPDSASPLPADESERLRSLRALDVLPTLTEPLFDAFVALTAQVFSLPISLIAVVEENEVLYPANFGMPGHYRQPRVETLCATAIEKARTASSTGRPAPLAPPSGTSSTTGPRGSAKSLPCVTRA